MIKDVIINYNFLLSIQHSKTSTKLSKITKKLFIFEIKRKKLELVEKNAEARHKIFLTNALKVK